MSKQTKSQWNFGELFPPSQGSSGATSPTEQGRKVLSVAELTAQVRRLLEQHVGTVWVGGEVSNLRAQSSGHIYFTLKDSAAQLNCVLFRDEARGARDLIEDGRKVILQGDVTVYEVRGQYQLIVRQVELQGVGALQIAFEKLKQKLQAEGLFAPERKRPLPKYPQRIGLVTSPTGAAIRDVLHVAKRRNPSLEIILASCRVQGEGAAKEIAAAIGLLNEFNVAAVCDRRKNSSGEVRRSQTAATNGLDLILVTRGGGSLEDLWAFNEEIVARAIFNSALPVVSAVGHEIDFTISDFVADVRAATPSAAAGIITEGVFSSREFVAEAGVRMSELVRQQARQKENALGNLAHRLSRLHPRRRFNDWLQRLDELQSSLLRCAKNAIRNWSVGMKNLEQRLNLLGPEQVLARGYSITMDAVTEKILRAAKEVKAGQKLKTRLKAGEVFSTTEK